MIYKIKIEPEAITDIKRISDWYNEQLLGLGNRFREIVVKQIDGLNKNPQRHAIRYNQIRCVLVKKFPYMIHVFVNEESKTVEILAVIGTSRDPNMWLKKTK